MKSEWRAVSLMDIDGDVIGCDLEPIFFADEIQDEINKHKDILKEIQSWSWFQLEADPELKKRVREMI